MMSQSLPTPTERARKGMQFVLQALQEPGKAGALAVAMGLSDSTVSRVKNERAEEVILFLAYLGLKVVPSEYRYVDLKTFTAIEVVYEKAMSRLTLSELLFQDTQQGDLA